MSSLLLLSTAHTNGEYHKAKDSSCFGCGESQKAEKAVISWIRLEIGNGSLLGTVQEAYELLLSSREGESNATANGFLEYWVMDGRAGRKKAVTEPLSLMPLR